jgi:hypothetical protein
MIGGVRQTWNGSNWVNGQKNTYTYDEDYYLIELLLEGWSGSNWVNSWKDTYTYDENHNMINLLSQHWDDSYWENFENNTYTYITIEREQELDYELYQNYPNPFNPVTTIRYELPQDGVVTIKIYDILGQEVETILNEFKEADRYEVDFIAIGLASGVYFYRLQAGSFVETRKMVLLK